MNLAGRLVPLAAIKAALVLAGSHSCREKMMMIIIPVMMTSPAVASWIRAQKEKRKRDLSKEERQNRLGERGEKEKKLKQ